MTEESHGPAVPLIVPTATGDVTGSGPGSYCGFTAAETGGTSAVAVTVYDSVGAPAGGAAPLETIRLAAGGSSSANYQRPARQVLNGLHVVVSGSGTVLGSLFQ